MSGVLIIRTLLAANAPLLLLVPAARVMAGVLPQATALPAVSVTEISTVELPHLDAQSPTTLVQERVQVTVLAADYPAQKALLAAARKAVNYQRGVIAGSVVASIRRGANGPDFVDAAAGFFMQSVDFEVIYHEAN